jgi:hypothetical protein
MEVVTRLASQHRASPEYIQSGVDLVSGGDKKLENPGEESPQTKLSLIRLRAGSDAALSNRHRSSSREKRRQRQRLHRNGAPKTIPLRRNAGAKRGKRRVLVRRSHAAKTIAVGSYPPGISTIDGTARNWKARKQLWRD